MQPTILIESLEGVRRRVRLLAVAYGTGLVVTAAICLLLGAVAADWLLNLPAVPRLVLVVAAAAAVGTGVWRWLVRPLAARLTLNDVAGSVERTYPQFQDRLRSSVDILQERDVPGSAVMKQRVVSEAARLTQSLDLSRVVVTRPAWVSSAGATAAVAVLAGVVAVVGPDFSKLAMARLLTPFSAGAWPKSVQLALDGAVPDRVTVGQRVDVNVRLTRGDKPGRRATILYQYGDAAGHFGPVQREYMTRGDDGVYHAAVDARLPDPLVGNTTATGRVQIRVEAGDDAVEVPPVRVVQRLTISRVEAVVTPPPYAGQPEVRVDLSQPVTATVGSAVRLVATFSKPLAADRPVTAELLGGAKGLHLTWAAAGPDAVAASFTAVASTRFHLHAVDADGVANTAAEEFELVVRPDQMPTVTIESPRRNEDRTPQAVVPLAAVAEDDFGIASVTHVIDRTGDKKQWQVPLVRDAAAASGARWSRVDNTTAAGGGDLVRFRASYDWDLSRVSPDLKAGDVLDYHLLARDNYALDGATHPPVSSTHLRLNIISQDELTNQVTAELQTVADQTSTLRRAQADTQRQTAALAKATAGKPQMDAADQVAADRLSGQQGTLASQAKSVANKLAAVRARLDENRSPNKDLADTAKDVGDLLNRAAEGPMKAAASGVSDAKGAPSPDGRQQSFKEANTAQTESAEALQKALDRMGNIGSLSRTIDAVRNLLADQQKVSAATAEAGKATLGQTPDQMKPEDKAKLDDAAKQQADLAARTAKALEEMGHDAEKLAKTDPSSSAAMKQAADTGQQQAVVPNQSKASQKAGENRQSEAQSAQKNAELGLQMILADLREAERHKLDELNRKLAELQQQVAVLIRRQAGHNLDTLALRGAAATAVDDATAVGPVRAGRAGPQGPAAAAGVADAVCRPGADRAERPRRGQGRRGPARRGRPGRPPDGRRRPDGAGHRPPPGRAVGRRLQPAAGERAGRPARGQAGDRPAEEEVGRPAGPGEEGGHPPGVRGDPGPAVGREHADGVGRRGPAERRRQPAPGGRDRAGPAVAGAGPRGRPGGQAGRRPVGPGQRGLHLGQPRHRAEHAGREGYAWPAGRRAGHAGEAEAGTGRVGRDDPRPGGQARAEPVRPERRRRGRAAAGKSGPNLPTEAELRLLKDLQVAENDGDGGRGEGYRTWCQGRRGPARGPAGGPAGPARPR